MHRLHHELISVGNSCFCAVSYAEEPASDAYAQKLCKAEGKQVANSAYICSRTPTMQRIDFLLAKDSDGQGKNKSNSKQKVRTKPASTLLPLWRARMRKQSMLSMVRCAALSPL